MGKLFLIVIFTFFIVFVNCVPTSVLVNKLNPNKVKRALVLPKEAIIKNNPQKRNTQFKGIPIDLSNDILVNHMPNMAWDDSDTFSDIQDIENRQKSYENLQNLLNSQLYSEPLPYKFYDDRKKRSNDLRFKRETTLSPAEILALLSWVEAGQESSPEVSNSYYYPKETNGRWLSSEVPLKYDYNRFNKSKRFMVAKKKRSLINQHLNQAQNGLINYYKYY